MSTVSTATAKELRNTIELHKRRLREMADEFDNQRDDAEWMTSADVAAWEGSCSSLSRRVLHEIAAGHPEPAFLARLLVAKGLA